MDMKLILQAIDGVATKPVAGANDMAKFLRVVKEANVEYLPPDPEVSAQLRAQSQASMDADGPKHQANTFIRFSSGMYDQSKLPKTMTIKPGVTLPIKFNPIKNMDGDVLANAIAANKLLPPDLQYSSAELSQVVGQNAIQETPEVLPAQQPAPVQENSLNKFLSIVKQNDVSILNEGANPHKVSLPVQMAMQHYQQEEHVHKPVGRDSVIRKYFKEVEEELTAEKTEKRQLINQYASIIAERVLMKESLDEACWDKYKQVGMKKKGRKMVPNCVPKESVAENADQIKKVFKDKSGKPVGEIGIDPESSPGNSEWYVHHYATGYSVVGFDSAAEAKRELMYVHKHPDAVEGHPSTKEQGMAEGLKSMYHNVVAKHHGRKADDAFDNDDEEGFAKHMDKSISHRLKAGEKIPQVRDPKQFQQGVEEGSTDELHADLSDKYNELAPGIEKYKDEKGADHLYKELLAIARHHGAEREFSRMCNGARNSAHMDYDTNPGHFKNWFWYLGLGNEQGVAENEIPGHSMGFTGGVGPGTLDNMIDEMTIEFNKENPIQSQINHKSNPGSIEYRIMRARSQIKDLATRVDSNELVVWESITRQFPELAMNIEEIRHGIEELAKIRKGGGRRSHNIDKHIGEAVMPAIKASKPTAPKTVKPKAKTSVCRAGQTQTGTQIKNGVSVPKCSVTSVKKKVTEAGADDAGKTASDITGMATSAGILSQLPVNLSDPVFKDFKYYTYWDLLADLGIVSASFIAGAITGPETVGTSTATIIIAQWPRIARIAKVIQWSLESLKPALTALRLLLPDVPSILKAIKVLVKLNPSDLARFIKIAGTEGVLSAFVNIGINFGLEKLDKALDDIPDNPRPAFPGKQAARNQRDALRKFDTPGNPSPYLHPERYPAD